MVTCAATIPFILLIVAFFVVKKLPIVVGILFILLAVISFIFSDAIITIPVTLFLEGSIFFLSGLVELKDRKSLEHVDNLPERSEELSTLINPPVLMRTWSSQKKGVLIFISVFLVLATSAAIDLVRYNQRTTRASALAELHFNHGLAYTDQGDYKSAIEEYTQAIQINPHYVDAYYYRGLAYASSAVPDMREAFDNFDRVIQLDSQYAMAYYNRGIHELGQQSSIDDLTIFLQLKPDDAMAYNYRGLAYYYMDDLDNAVHDFSQAIQLDPGFAIAYNNRGLAYAGKGDLDQAMIDYDDAILLKQDFGAAYFNRGQAYFDKGNLELAIQDWEQTLSVKPDSPLFSNRGYTNYDRFTIYYNLGLAYYGKGNLDLAIDEFDRAQASLPAGHTKGMYMRGVVYYYKGMYSQALKDLEHNQPVYPDDLTYFYYQGLIYFYTGNESGAIKDFYIVLIHNLAYSTLLLDWYENIGTPGYKDRVIRDFDRAIQLYPNDPQLYFFRGLTYSLNGETENAIADLNTVLKRCTVGSSLCKDATQAIQKLRAPHNVLNEPS